MLISLNWLKKFVDLTGVETEELVRLIGARLVEVEGVIDQRAKYNNIYVVRVVGAEKIAGTHLTLCKIDDGGAFGKGVKAEGGDSVVGGGKADGGVAGGKVGGGKIGGGGKGKVTRDDAGLVQVMCGAPNCRAGMLAVWIAPGAVVPASVREDAPFVIGTRKMLGKYESHGMLAGADELDFGDQHETIAEISPDDAKAGTPFGELFGLSDIILEIENKSLTHRPDCFGVIGFAREVAGILGQKFETPEWLLADGLADFAHFEFFSAVRAQRMSNTSRPSSSKEDSNCTEVCKADELLKVRIDDDKICPRYTALIMEKHGKEKVRYLGEMETLLARSGMRPISPLVDVTNYLMLLAGQPLHAFDYDKFIEVGGGRSVDIAQCVEQKSGKIAQYVGQKGEKIARRVEQKGGKNGGGVGGKGQKGAEIVVRLAQKGEEIVLLDEQKVQLNENDIVICSGEVPVALAGAMGGKDTEIDENTRKIIVESATFSLYNLRKTQMAHGIFSEAITRFTKGLPAGQTLPVVKEFARLAAGGMKSVALVDEWPGGDRKSVVEITVRQINELLGTGYSCELIKRTLECVGFDIVVENLEPTNSSELSVLDFLLRCVVPYWRTDIAIPEDIIEEVGRLLGYDNIAPRVPLHGTAGANELLALKERVRSVLAGAGANELLTYSFVHGDLLVKVGQDVGNSYKIVNSISPDLQYVRQQIAPSLLVKAYENLKDGQGEFGLFEMNQVFLRDGGMDGEGVPVLNNNLAFVYVAKDRKSCFYQAKKYLLYLSERLNMRMKLDPLGINVSASRAKSCKYDSSVELGVCKVLGDGLPRHEAFYEPKRSAKVMVDGEWVGVIGEVKKATAHALKLPEGTAAFELGLGALLGKVGGVKKSFETSEYPSVGRDITLTTEAGVSYEKVVGQIEKLLADRELMFVVEPMAIYQGGGSAGLKVSFHLEFASLEKTLTNAEIVEIMAELERVR